MLPDLLLKYFKVTLPPNVKKLAALLFDFPCMAAYSICAARSGSTITSFVRRDLVAP